jgi:hypothetical protein
MTTNRSNNRIVIIADSVDVGAIEDPDHPDFLGYKKPWIAAIPEFGTEARGRSFVQSLESHIFQSPTKVVMKTYGRPTLKPFDIVGLQMPQEGERSFFGVNNPAGDNPTGLNTYIKLRVLSIAGEINLTGEMKYGMTIVAEHK